MKAIKVIATAAFVIAAGHGQAREPLSFDYLVTGSQALRPLLVFNDGMNTYIQPPEWAANASKIVGADAERYGVYWLVKGVPDQFFLKLKTEVATIALAKKTRAADMASSMQSGDIAKKGVCDPQLLRTEKTFIVGFERGSTNLTNSMALKIERAAGNTDSVGAVRIRVPLENTRDETVKRGYAIRDLLVSLGVRGERISIDHRGNPVIGTELLFVHEKKIGCKSESQSQSVVSVPTWDQATVIDQGSAEDVARRIANAAGLIFRIEGNTSVPINVSVSQVDKPLVSVLESLARQIGRDADLIFRNHEIVIKYREKS